MEKILKREVMKVSIITREYQIVGEIQTHEGYRGRLSDLINDDKKFIGINNAEVTFFTDRTKRNVKFLCINKESILMVYPSE